MTTSIHAIGLAVLACSFMSLTGALLSGWGVGLAVMVFLLAILGVIVLRAKRV